MEPVGVPGDAVEPGVVDHDRGGVRHREPEVAVAGRVVRDERDRGPAGRLHAQRVRADPVAPHPRAQHVAEGVGADARGERGRAPSRAATDAKIAGAPLGNGPAHSPAAAIRPSGVRRRNSTSASPTARITPRPAASLSAADAVTASVTSTSTSRAGPPR